MAPVSFPTQFCAPAMFLSLISRNQSTMLGDLQWRNIYTTFHENRSAGSKVERGHIMVITHAQFLSLRKEMANQKTITTALFR